MHSEVSGHLLQVEQLVFAICLQGITQLDSLALDKTRKF